VLLGSSRGATTGLDLAAWQHKALVLIGAHASSVPQSDPSPRAWTWRRECETVLELLRQGRLQHAPLITRRVTPDRAPEVYRDLARPEDRSVAVLFDWSAPGAWRSRIETASPLRVAAAGARWLLGRVAPAAPVFLPRRGDGRVLRFGLIGCGEIAVESAAALRGAANAAVTFAVDPEIALARSLAAATGARASERVEELLRSPEVDAVLISTPHHLHAPLAIQAAEAGKHVVVEKPMATSVADCDRMIAAAERHGVRLSVCYCQRYDPRVQRARTLLAAGALGEVLSTRITFGQHRPAAYWTQGLTGRSAGDWRGRRATAGGGVLIMNACHLLDSMGWLLGRAVAEVTACTATLVHDVEVEDTIAMSYRYAGGGLGSLEATTAVAGPGTFEQVLRGREGLLQLAPELRFWSRRTIQGHEPARWHAVRGLPRAAERRHYFEAFAQAVLDGTALPVSAGEAREVQAVVEAAYRAAELGRAVRTEELAP